MAAILNSAILDSDTCHLGFRHLLIFSQIHFKKTGSLHLHKKNLHSFILTQLDDGSHLEFCHVGFRHCHLGFRHLVYLLSDSLKNTLTPLWLWLKLIQSDSNSFILTQLDDGSHLEFCHLEFGHLGFSHLSFSSQTHSHLPRLVPTICTKKTSLIHSDSTWWWQPSWILPCWIQTLPSWIQTPCYLLSDSLKNTLTPLWLWLKLIQSDSNSFILTQLDDGSHLEFCHLEFGHLGFSHLSFSSQTHSHLPRLVPTICTKKPSLIHSDSTWWWQPSWILPSWIQPFCTKTSLIHSDSTWWWQPSWILPSWIQTSWIQPLRFTLKLTHTCQDWFPPFAQKKLHSFILTQLDDGSHLEFCHVEFRHCHLGFRHLVIFSQIHSKTLSLHSDSDSN